MFCHGDGVVGWFVFCFLWFERAWGEKGGEERGEKDLPCQNENHNASTKIQRPPALIGIFPCLIVIGVGRKLEVEGKWKGAHNNITTPQH